MDNNIKKALALTLALTMAFGMAACGNTDAKNIQKKKTAATTADETPEPEVSSAAEDETESEADSEAEKEATEYEKYLGEKSSKDADFSLEIKNGTDKSIIGFAIKYGDENYSKNLIPSGEEFEADEVRQLNWSHESPSGEVISLEDYTVELTFENYDVFELHSFPLTDMVSGEIRLMDTYAFLVYTNKIGDNKNTKSSEAALAEKEDEEEETTTTTAPKWDSDDSDNDEPDNDDSDSDDQTTTTTKKTTTTSSKKTTTTTTTTPYEEEPEPSYSEDIPSQTEPPSADDGCVGDDAFTF